MPARPVPRFLKRLITPPLLVLVTLALLVEEALWRLSAVVAWLGRFPVFRQIERFVSGLPPYPALACFLVPAVALAPVKLLALYWLAGGHPGLGITVIVAAKVTGTALMARIFQLTRASLLTVAWFRRAHDFVLSARAALYGWWRGSSMGRWVLGRWERMKRTQPSWLRRRWAAARERMRKSG